MAPDPTSVSVHAAQSDTFFRRVLGGMSAFTMLMTVPQIWTIWANHQAAGVSVLSWGAYLLSALLWFWHGVQQRDKNIYLACIGWIGLDLGVIIGALTYG
jgi:uncharacterized protein with PQ loop repeat